MRYVDELPPANRRFYEAVLAVRRLNDPEAALLRDAQFIVDMDRASRDVLAFEKFATSSHKEARWQADVRRRDRAVARLFGRENGPDIWNLLADIADKEDEGPPVDSDRHRLERLHRIADRFEDRCPADLDLDWLRQQSVGLTDKDILGVSPFEGDRDSTAHEFCRKVVKARKEHVCHWTRLPIRPGDRHLYLREMDEGLFLVTRHSLVACLLMIEGHDPACLDLQGS